MLKDRGTRSLWMRGNPKLHESDRLTLRAAKAVPPSFNRQAISPAMKLPSLPMIALSSILGFAACDRQVVLVEKAPATPMPDPVARTKTLETSRLGSAVDLYEREPSAGNKAAVNKALAELDGEIAELQEYITKHDGDAREKAAGKLQNLQSYRAAETLRFTAAQARGAVGGRPAVDIRSGAEKMEDGAKKVGKSIEDAAKKTGDAIKDAVR